jgi:hypothetical protein
MITWRVPQRGPYAAGLDDPTPRGPKLGCVAKSKPPSQICKLFSDFGKHAFPGPNQLRYTGLSGADKADAITKVMTRYQRSLALAFAPRAAQGNADNIFSIAAFGQ